MGQIHHRAGIFHKNPRPQNGERNLQHAVPNIHQEVGRGEERIRVRQIDEHSRDDHGSKGNDADRLDSPLTDKNGGERAGNQITKCV